MDKAIMTTRRTRCVLFSIFIIVILWTNLSTAAIIQDGDFSPTYDPNEGWPWRIDNEPELDDLIVGNTAYGRMEITDGFGVVNINGYIGKEATASGLVTVTGQTTYLSGWKNDGDLYVGYSGIGELEIFDNGDVSSSRGIIGYMPGSRGTVDVNGLGSEWSNNGHLYVGFAGTGEMNISNGGYVYNDANGYIAFAPGSSGTVDVNGPDSEWYNNGKIYVGGSEEAAGGTGLLNIINDGVVQADSVVIWPTGTLSGDGTIVSDSVLNSGTIKPGNTFGTLTIEGNLTMQPGSIYEVDVDSSGNSDLLSVTGDVNIVGGTVKAASTDTVMGVKQYTIIEADNITGTFDAVDTALIDTEILVSDDVSIENGVDSLVLQINAKRFDDPGIVKTANQKAIARALKQIDVAAGGDNTVTTALQSLESIDDVRDAYNQLSGQTTPQLMPVAAVDTSKFMGIISDRLNYAKLDIPYGPGSDSLLAMAEPDKTNPYARSYYTSPFFSVGDGTTDFDYEKWGFWGKGYGVFGDRKTKGEAAGYKYAVYGTSFGLDYQSTKNSLLGVTAGYSKSLVDSSIPGNESDISSTHIGIYSNRNTDFWHFDTIFTYSSLEYETERFININIVSEKIKGNSEGQGISGYVETRYDLGNFDRWLLQPLASFQFSFLTMDGYTETGGASSLGFDDQDYNSYKGSLGIKLTQELFAEGSDRIANIQLRGRLIHEFGDDNSSVDAHFASDPGVIFNVSDEDIARNSVLLGASLNAYVDLYTWISLTYDAHLNSDNNMHILSAMFVYKW